MRGKSSSSDSYSSEYSKPPGRAASPKGSEPAAAAAPAAEAAEAPKDPEIEAFLKDMEVEPEARVKADGSKRPASQHAFQYAFIIRLLWNLS